MFIEMRYELMIMIGLFMLLVLVVCDQYMLLLRCHIRLNRPSLQL